MKKTKWHFRNNIKRKKGNKNKGKHPCLVVGESEDGKSYYNLGLTSSEKRGHHKNIEIHNPQNWKEKSYLRDDLRVDDKKHLSDIFKEYNLCQEDINKILTIINKKNSR